MRRLYPQITHITDGALLAELKLQISDLAIKVSPAVVTKTIKCKEPSLRRSKGEITVLHKAVLSHLVLLRSFSSCSSLTQMRADDEGINQKQPYTAGYSAYMYTCEYRPPIEFCRFKTSRCRFLLPALLFLPGSRVWGAKAPWNCQFSRLRCRLILGAARCRNGTPRTAVVAPPAK